MTFSVDTQGCLRPAKQCPSPNFNARPEHGQIDLLVIHNISLPPGQFGGNEIEAFFQNQLDSTQHPYFETINGLEVSAHLLIRRNGDVVQFVPFNQRAWHAGVSEFCGRTACNDFSIGIELEGTDSLAYTDIQYEVLSQVTQALQNAYPALKDFANIMGHCDIAPERKTDPGDAFDWQKYKQMTETL